MAGIVIFDHGQSSWAASGGAFMNVVESISTKLNLDMPTVEANMLLDLANGDLKALSILINSINETWQIVLVEQVITEKLTASYLLSLSDLKTLAVFNLLKHQGKLFSFNTGPLGTIKYRDCSWSAPRYIFNHLVERFASGARSENALALTKNFIKARVEDGPTFLDMTVHSAADLSIFGGFAEPQMASYLNKKGLRFADHALFSVTQPYAQSLSQFVSCLQLGNSVSKLSTIHSVNRS